MVHEWLGDLLAVIRAPRLVRRAVRKVINLWRTDLEIVTETGTARIRVRFLRGLFQGDVLSPLLFVLPVAPLSLLLGIAGGYNTAHNARLVTHLLFMDDLKVFEQSKAELESTLEVVGKLARVVGMYLGVGKCAVAHIRAGRVQQLGGATSDSEDINELNGKSYRSLGVEQVFGPRSRETKDKVVQEYLRRGQVVWSSSLSAAAKVRAHNSWVVSVLRYTMPLVEWFRRELEQLDVRTRALLTKCEAHCPNASKDRLYLP